MITEDYCSFEVAQLLKEKGFPQEYDIHNAMVYNEEDYEYEYEVQRMVTETKLVKAGTLSSYPASVPESRCYCPTLQMAMKWLRRYGWVICIIPLTFCCGEGISKWGCCVWKDDNLEIDEDDTPKYNTYEQACESAIKYCLEYLSN